MRPKEPANSLRITRRTALATMAAGGAAFVAMPRVFAQSERTVKLTLPWLAQGPTAFAYIADSQGMFKKRGLKAEISRGFGSLAAVQALGGGRFDFGLSYAGAAIVSAATGVPVVALGSVNYDAYMGILLKKNSPIRVPKDLDGKTLGGVLASAEAPYWPAFAELTHVDLSTIKHLQSDPRVLERTLVDGQIDGAICICSSSYAVATSIGQPTRAMLWADYGLSFYANGILTRPDILEKDPALCGAVTDALLEGLAFCLRDPDRSLDIFMRVVPELGLTKGGREFARLGQGFMLASVVRPEAIEHALGYSDPAKIAKMVDLAMKYAVGGQARRPDPDTLYTNRFIGNVKLDPGEWDKARQATAGFPKLLRG